MTEQTAHPPTPSEIRSRNHAKRRKPKKVPGKCKACDGKGEIFAVGQHASRCPDCLGSGMAQQSLDGKTRAFVFGSTSR